MKDRMNFRWLYFLMLGAMAIMSQSAATEGIGASLTHETATKEEAGATRAHEAATEGEQVAQPRETVSASEVEKMPEIKLDEAWLAELLSQVEDLRVVELKLRPTTTTSGVRGTEAQSLLSMLHFNDGRSDRKARNEPESDAQEE